HHSHQIRPPSPTSTPISSHFFFLLIPRPPTSTLFPYTTLFRSVLSPRLGELRLDLIFPFGQTCGEARLGLVQPMLQRNHLRLTRSEEHTSELQSRGHLVCRLLLEKKKELYVQLPQLVATY